MKTQPQPARFTLHRLLLALALALCSTLNSQFSTGFAQGSLTPPGPPAPLMKTLDQIEPRTPIGASTTPGDADSLFKIIQPGSYYLTTNLTGVAAKHGIEIAASGVTLDLMGFDLAGVAGSLDGVNVNTFVINLAVRNGSVRNWGSAGVRALDARNGQYQDLRLFANGFLGLSCGESSAVVNCTARSNTGDGIYTTFGCIVSGCTASINTGDGIVAISSSTISGCTAYGNAGDGIQVSQFCRVVNNICDFNGAGGDGASINVTGGANRIEGNHCTDADRGLDVDAANNYIADNTVRGNTDNYDIVAGNQVNILLGELPETIEVPATVKLSGTLTGVTGQAGITIMAGDVTVDLGGHALVGVTGSLDGITVPFVLGLRTNISVRNGTVRNWGGDGVDTGSAVNGQYQDLRLSANGGDGLICGEGGAVVNCSARGNTGIGILALLGCTISDCTASANTGNGIAANGGSTISGCTARGNSGDGIAAGLSTTVSGCTATLNTDDGIQVNSDCRVVDNKCYFNGNVGDGAGIHVVGSDNRIESNNVTDNDRGIDVDFDDNLIIRNSASGNTTNYEIAVNNKVGVIVAAPNSLAISGSTGGAGVGTTDPWANISF